MTEYAMTFGSDSIRGAGGRFEQPLNAAKMALVMEVFYNLPSLRKATISFMDLIFAQPFSMFVGERKNKGSVDRSSSSSSSSSTSDKKRKEPGVAEIPMGPRRQNYQLADAAESSSSSGGSKKPGVKHEYVTPDLTLVRERHLANQSELTEQAIAKYWMPAVRAMYEWDKMFGIVPWYLDRDPEDGLTLVLRVPPPETGNITACWSVRRHSVKYRWYWRDRKRQDSGGRPLADPRVRFLLGAAAPGLDGSLRTEMAAFVHEYQTHRIRVGAQTEWMQSTARPLLVFGSVPPSSSGGADAAKETAVHIQSGEQHAGIAQTISSKASRIRTHEMFVVLREQLDAINSASYMYDGAGAGGPDGQALSLGPHDAAAQREQESELIRKNVGRRLVLPPYHNHTMSAPPSLAINLDAEIQRIDNLAYAVCDYSAQLVMSRGSDRLAANVESAVIHTNERAKAWIRRMQGYLEIIVGEAYADVLQKMKANARLGHIRHFEREISAEDNTWLENSMRVHVIFPAVPYMTYERLKAMHTDGMISHPIFARYAMAMVGIPLRLYAGEGTQEERTAAEAQRRELQEPSASSAAKPKKDVLESRDGKKTRMS